MEGLTPERFAFDPAGNVLDNASANIPTGASRGYVQGNRLKVFQDLRFDYDDVGNLIHERRGRRSEIHYHYNRQNQLIQVDKDGQTTRYAYDPFGRRILKQDAFGETAFLWDGDHLIQEQRRNIQITYAFEPGSFEPLCQIRDGEVYHYHNDHLGTPQVMTDHQGEVVWRARYRVYGNVVKYDVEEIDNPLRFQGQYFDVETGLHYNRHRYYNPNIGQFINQDPIGLLGGLNCYQYAPNPTGWVDPLGLSCKEVSFAHGTSLDIAKEIAKNGLDAEKLLANCIGSHEPGSFFTHQLGPPDNPGPGLQEAANWAGPRYGNEIGILIMTIPKSVYQDLEIQGLVRTGAVPGGTPDMPPETIFKPEAFDVINQHAKWQVLPLN